MGVHFHDAVEVIGVDFINPGSNTISTLYRWLLERGRMWIEGVDLQHGGQLRKRSLGCEVECIKGGGADGHWDKNVGEQVEGIGRTWRRNAR